MREAEQLSELIGDVYDTVLDRSLWPGVLRKASLYIQGAASAVFWNDAVSGSGDVYFDDGGIGEEYTGRYFATYAKLNPTTTPRFFADPEEPTATADLMPYDEFLRTRFYREWARPQGLVDFVSVTLEKAAASAAMFGVFRHERHGLVDDATRARMRLLAPHIRRAVLISKVVDLKRSEAATFTETFDGLRAAIFLVDAGGRIVHANTAGHRLLADGDVLRAVGGRLASNDTHIDSSLRDILAACAGGDSGVGPRGIALPLTDADGERHVAHVLPLTSGARRQAGATHRATAAVFVHKATLEGPSPPRAIAEAYGLTLAELRVLFAIVEVGGVPEVAEVLGIAASTVKTHLSRIYEKAGMSRQADLVKLVAGFASPLAR